MLSCSSQSSLNMYMYRLIVVLSLLVLYNSVNIDLTTSDLHECGNGCRFSVYACCAETNAYCCHGSYKECEVAPQLPNCYACCVPHAAKNVHPISSSYVDAEFRSKKPVNVTMSSLICYDLPCMFFGCILVPRALLEIFT